MAIIRNRQDWWQAVDYLLSSGQLTGIINNAVKPGERAFILATMKHEIEKRNHKQVHKGMQHLWELAPNDPIIHKWAGWNDLCDVCSEFWVFE